MQEKYKLVTESPEDITYLYVWIVLLGVGEATSAELYGFCVLGCRLFPCKPGPRPQQRTRWHTFAVQSHFFQDFPCAHTKLGGTYKRRRSDRNCCSLFLPTLPFLIPNRACQRSACVVCAVYIGPLPPSFGILKVFNKTPFRRSDFFSIIVFFFFQVLERIVFFFLVLRAGLMTKRHQNADK